MRKIFLVLITMFACTQLASAQKNYGTQFSVNLGINASQVTDANNYSSDAVAGLNAGIAVDHNFSRDWGISVGLNYQQKGWGNGFVILPDNSEIDGVNYKLNYLTVPVLAKWHFGRTNNWYVDLGPYVGFLLSASESSNTVFDAKSYFNNVDGGLALGIGVKIPINRYSHFFIEYAAQAGVANVYRDSYSSVQNITNGLNVGIGF
ncbi:porin family protein [Mucilaginibacter ximonensis]|uniref:Porin family protein n=1 Tax=Mucilaginibacter ximonensis TaxID=538021 RepID=A0ABW5Y7V5_9SPHI